MTPRASRRGSSSSATWLGAVSGRQGIDYPHRYLAPVNTGVDSGLDLDRDGATGGPADALGFGRHPGHYGMLLLSRHPILAAEARSFRTLPWAALPGALRPPAASGEGWFWSDEEWRRLPLSSKSHWVVPVETPIGRIEVIAAHPTPPVFDGPERRNARRNHDEIRLLAALLEREPGPWLVDDQGRPGPLPAEARFVILGDLNADPADGASWPGAIAQLLEHPRVDARFVPRSAGAVRSAARRGGANLRHRGDHAADTADFGPEVGNLRVDYVLPGAGLCAVDGGVFWPAPEEPGAEWVEASDHRLVWLDLAALRGGRGPLSVPRPQGARRAPAPSRRAAQEPGFP
ncbi:MAG: endonuclease/exonuclease/phosphatase family protein [Xanthomonadales bacterium]|nr:endonuclease/exonuclease/phosphatase family protein [Xanthomonadales bacterium]